MRTQIELQSEWWVSVSENDARLAANADDLSGCTFEVGNDAENYPQQIDLPGGWQYGKRPLVETSLSTEEKVKADAEFVGGGADVPSESKRLPAHYLTYLRKVFVPENWNGHTIFLQLDKTRYHVTVKVNGKEVNKYVGGLEPHRINITDSIIIGADNEISITVGDVGVSGHREFDPFNYTGTRLPTCKEIENNLVHPVHYGGFDGRGMERATLVAVPAVRVEYVFANPKVSVGLLRYTVAMANDSDSQVMISLNSIAKPSLLNISDLIKTGTVYSKLLIDDIIIIPANSVKKVTVDVPWTDARLWDTDDPFLYDLITVLKIDGNETDLHTDSFGFREFIVNGHNFILNGRKIHLFGQSGHVGAPQNAMSLDEKINFLRIAKEKGNINHVRLHAIPQDKRWVEAADRVGMLITTETALWTTGFHSFDWAGSEEECYHNVRNHFMEALVYRDRNSPSLVIWSMSNEMSPITEWDLTYPGHGAKMSAMTRIFKRILEETRNEDDSRVVQMSSAMDFIGNLEMYNLHYPKNWQAYPDYPHTAYWLDGAFKFRWYGCGYQYMPSWSWRKDKPLYFGEYTCVYGATPDNQASIVGDAAFEAVDFGSGKVQEKLWWMEAQAYRRQDVSGFCAWAFLLTSETDCNTILASPDAAAYVNAIRLIAVLNHSYHTDYYAGDEVAFPLSVHNDTRHDIELKLVCEVIQDGKVINTETMPARLMTPGESIAFTNRFLAPNVENCGQISYRATLTSDGKVVDQWIKQLTVWPVKVNLELPADFGIFDPDEKLAVKLEKSSISGGQIIRHLEKSALKDLKVLWLSFAEAKANTGDWRRIREELQLFVKNGGSVILDKAPATVLHDLPVPIKNGKGFADGDRLEITYAYPRAPFHPVLKGLNDFDFSLWGDDYYVAHSCIEIPQEGNAVPLLVAGTDRAGLSSSPLLELRYGRGSYLVNTLEILSKLNEAPVAARLLGTFANYHPSWGEKSTAVSMTEMSWQRLQEVGFDGENADLAEALQAEISVVEGAKIETAVISAVKDSLTAGRTVCIHELNEEMTTALLKVLNLPGNVVSGKAESGEWDVFLHNHSLANGMTHNYLYWIVDKSKVAPWTLAPTHPEPASALIKLPENTENAVSLTKRGAVTVYNVGAGILVIDNLRWQLDNFDEPERPRRYVRSLLTNLGIPLLRGVEKHMGEEFETEAERRERGHF